MILGKPLKAASTNMDKLTGWKKVGFFVGMLIVTLSVNGAPLETKDATIENLPFIYYGIAFAVALLVGFFTRKLFISLDTETKK